jgi:hypothetical protein
MARRRKAPEQVEPPAPPPAAAPRELVIEYVDLDTLREYENNPRRHTPAMVEAQAKLLDQFGFRAPFLVKKRDDNLVCDGHLRLKAARLRGIKRGPITDVSDLSDAKIRALRVAMNKSADLAEWDSAKLAIELRAVDAADLPMVELTAFTQDEIAKLLGPGTQANDSTGQAGDGAVPPIYAVVIDCSSESEQKSILERLLKDGVACRALM